MEFMLSNALLYGKAVDIVVADGCITEVVQKGEGTPPENGEVIDAQGKKVFPSFIDAHVHLREPGFEYKEDISTGLKAAAHGGFGAVMAMANTSPVNDSAAVTQAMQKRASEEWPDGPRLYPIGAATIGLHGTELAPLKELHDAGCVAISNDGLPVGGAEMFRRCMEYAHTFGMRIIDHCEDPTLAKGAHMNEGVTSGKLGVKGQAVVAESMQVSRDILLAEYLDIPVHLAHMSCRQSIELIRWAKSRGVKVTAETCPHYLLLDDTALENYSALAKVNPPLRTPDDVVAVREAVADGTIDIFVTDHAPHAEHEKEVTLDESPNGISGLDTAVALTWRCVQDGELTEEQFAKLWCYNTSEIFNLPVNTFEQGSPADFFLFDPEEEWIVSPETMHSKGKNTPFLGQTLRGKVIAHWLGGKRIV